MLADLFERNSRADGMVYFLISTSLLIFLFLLSLPKLVNITGNYIMEDYLFFLFFIIFQKL